MTPELDAILGLVRQRTGVDFSRYREATVERRVANRMISVGARTFGSYLVRLEADQDEARHLLSRISIKVSRFYRHTPRAAAPAHPERGRGPAGVDPPGQPADGSRRRGVVLRALRTGGSPWATPSVRLRSRSSAANNACAPTAKSPRPPARASRKKTFRTRRWGPSASTCTPRWARSIGGMISAWCRPRWCASAQTITAARQKRRA